MRPIVIKSKMRKILVFILLVIDLLLQWLIFHMVQPPYNPVITPTAFALLRVFSLAICTVLLGFLIYYSEKRALNFNNSVYLIVMILLMLLLSGCSASPENQAKQIPVKSVQSLCRLKEKNNSFFLVISKEDCPFCNDFLPLVSECASELSADFFECRISGKEDLPSFDALGTGISEISAVPALFWIGNDGSVAEYQDIDSGNRQSLENWLNYMMENSR